MNEVETYATSEKADKVCVHIPIDLVPGQYKFESYVHKAHENGNITIGMPSLRALTVEESLQQVGMESKDISTVQFAMVLAFGLIVIAIIWRKT
jgi:hypothetical protein